MDVCVCVCVGWCVCVRVYAEEREGRALSSQSPIGFLRRKPAWPSLLFLPMQVRMVRYWEAAIQPHMRQASGRRGDKAQPVTFLLVSHANTIRALMAHIDGLQVSQ
jgi:hypothetical protein